ncbi:FAD-dependent oxidoreductase [Roseateles toxinivorans]|uniref:3-(3-hydroxy-phenyl)propionate hydroxylase n=1 Tax=Roseateles toxinivorans TaxID=270368 RepID=A0A4R6QK05_9BURK|nr:FAD-dependent oxidoreductase [Roseateles toxinivorans]TDP63233.1 3-(3-hydroxy-phenyl)propionate hydroxylase [Roseateles toxinivorans]
MQNTYTYPEFEYRQSDEQRRGELRRHALVIIGAGPIGLTMALDCAARGIATVVLDDNNSVSIGSRAVCYAKRTLEVWNRLGVVEPLLAQGVSWQVGKVFFRDELAYQFDLLPQAQQQMPAMINLQQYYLEEQLVAACDKHPLVDLRWKHRLTALEQGDDGALLTIETPDGSFKLQADWVVACDGANSDTRRMLGADFQGQVFQDRFLIADVVMTADFPTERWFWFDPPFHRGQSVLLHKQSNNVWRIDFQLGRDADPTEEKKPENVIPRIRAMLGPDARFELEWVSVYQFACRRIDQFRHGRVLFAGDAAHQVSPFGARGANTGVQDCDNLAWKLAAVMDGRAPEALLDSYHAERAFAADDNLLQSTRSTDFITPKTRASLRLRNAVLELAKTEAFARPLVNSGRLSTPTPYTQSPLITADEDRFDGGVAPGSPCVDAPLPGGGWLLEALGEGFVLLSFGEVGPCPLPVLVAESSGLLAERYDGRPGTCYLIRPDQYVAARWRGFDAAKVAAAVQRSLGVKP